MSESLQTCLIIVAANLIGMLVIYSFMAFTLAKLNWQGRGLGGVLATITIAQLFWIAPALLVLGFNSVDARAAWTIWFGNWLVSGFSVVALWQTVRWIPRQMEDSARLDGCGAFGIFRHVVLPLVRRELGLIATLTLMATLLPYWAFVTTPDASDSIVIFQRVSSPTARFGMMVAGSLLGMLPVIAIFFFAKRPLPHATAEGRTGSIPSTR